jgi:hypothetical protein
MKPVDYTVINPKTKEVIKSGHCHPQDLKLQAKPGQRLITGARGDSVDHVAHCVKGKWRLKKQTAAKVRAHHARTAAHLAKAEALNPLLGQRLASSSSVGRST